MKPAPPVTSRDIVSGYFLGAVASLLERVVDLVPARFELLRLLQVWKGLVAAAELHQRVAEVVADVRSRRISRILEALHRLLEQGQRAGVVAALHQRPRLVVER